MDLQANPDEACRDGPENPEKAFVDGTTNWKKFVGTPEKVCTDRPTDPHRAFSSTIALYHIRLQADEIGRCTASLRREGSVTQLVTAGRG